MRLKMITNKVKLTWFGHCCFLIELAGRKILTDPYDTFNNVDVGQIESEYLLISSTWHDHGNIATSPKSHILSYSGRFEKDNLLITGIETRETRGTPNIIFNIQQDGVSITNFADWGDPSSIKEFTREENNILQSTNIAFARSNEIDIENGIQCAELALRVCKPRVLVIHHFFPRSFITEQDAKIIRKGLVYYETLLDRLTNKLPFKTEFINDYKTDLDITSLQQNTMLVFSKVHPQVRYLKKGGV